MKTARDLFAKGDRVRLSERGRGYFKKSWAYKPDRLGTVTGFGTGKESIRVLLDGNKTAATNWMGYWEKI